MYRRAIKRTKVTPQETVDESKKCRSASEDTLTFNVGDSSRVDEDEDLLESLVVGTGADIVESLDKQRTKSIKKDEDGQIQHRPAWEDEDDEVEAPVDVTRKRKVANIHTIEEELTLHTYKEHLKKEFSKVTGNANWAKLKWQSDNFDDEQTEEEEGDELLRQTGNYLRSKSDLLPKGNIQMKPCTDGNKDAPSKSRIKSVEFHPTSQVLLTAGIDQNLSLFQVDGKNNPKIQSLFMKRFPIHTAHFSRDGTEVFMGSRYSFFNVYDMIAGKVTLIPKIKGLEENQMKNFVMSPDGKMIAFLGKYGYIHLVSAHSKEWISSLKMNGSIESLCFSRDASKMYSTGDDGEIYVWDTNARQCIHRFVDDGCICGTAINMSPNGHYLAAGSNSGVVNIYDIDSLNMSRPKPLKAIMNLTTPCTNIKFHPSNELIVASSDQVDKALKLIHLPSMTVFSNFPSRTDIINIVTAFDMSPNGGYLALGNHKGTVPLYRIKHYSNY